MLDEAMAQYGSLQCVDQIAGPKMAAQYRATGYPGYGAMQCARGAIMFGPTGVDRPLSNLPSVYDQVYHLLADAKGFLVWDTIARYVGRDRFRQALHNVVSKYGGGTVTFDQFLDALRSAARKNIDAILSQWLARSGWPVLSSEWKQSGDTVQLTLHQSKPTYILRLPVVLEFKDGTQLKREFDLSTESKSFQVPVDGLVSAVKVDPDWEVFHSTPELEAEALNQKESTLGMFKQMRGK